MSEPWWASFYDDTLADVVMATGEDAAAIATAEFLREKLHLRPGDQVFDQCCGIGRVSLPLARRGLRVVGVDVIPSYVARASAAADAARLPCEVHAGDAFEFVPAQPCSAAYNWWTSFGYTESDDQNTRMLRRAWEALTPGGRFALDYYNVPRLLREFQGRVQLRYQTESGEFLVERAAEVHFLSGMIDQEWSYTGPDGAEHRKRSRTKLYMPHELQALLLRSGFTEVQLYGGAGAEAFTPASPRCVLVARKPG